MWDPVISPGPWGHPFAGVYRRIDVPAPAAGGEWTVSIPGGEFWRLIIGRARLTAAAGGGNRTPGLRILDPDLELFASATSIQISPGTSGTVGYSDMPVMPIPFTSGVSSNVVLPPVILHPGWQLQSLTASLGVGDQYDQVRLWVQAITLGQGGAPFGRLDQYQPHEHPGG